MIRSLALIVTFALVGCARWGGYIGSAHGRSSTPRGDVDISTSEYEMTLDFVFHRVVFMSSLGASDIGARLRLEPEKMIDKNSVSGIDFTLGGGFGIDLVESRGLYVMGYGMYLHGFGIGFGATLDSRYTAGVQVGGGVVGGLGVWVRAGISRSSGTYYSNQADPVTFENISYAINPTLYFLEVGVGLDGTGLPDDYRPSFFDWSM